MPIIADRCCARKRGGVLCLCRDTIVRASLQKSSAVWLTPATMNLPVNAAESAPAALLSRRARRPKAPRLRPCGMEAELARRAPPAMTAPVLAARMPWPTGHLGVRFHHRAQRLDPGRQAEPIERRRHLFPRLTHRRARHCTRHHARCFHGVAFHLWNQHPEPTGSRRVTPLLLVQHRPGQFRSARATTKR